LKREIARGIEALASSPLSKEPDEVVGMPLAKPSLREDGLLPFLRLVGR